MGQVSLISEYIVHTRQSCAYVEAASLYATKLNYAQLSALSFYSHERHHSKTGRRSSGLLSASLAQAQSWTTTACLMKNHLGLCTKLM